MSKRMRRKARKTRLDSNPAVEFDSPAGRWILLPGGFGLQRPCSFGNGKTPA